jgi:hypothetical protein
MPFTYVPLLAVQRDLYRMPRGMERFQAYLKTMIDARSGDLRLPLSGMNPMGKDHLPRLLDLYLDLRADEVGAATAARISVTGDYRVTTVLSDDAMGGWTNRYASEFAARFETKPLLKRGWIVATLWTSESPSAARVTQEVATATHRAAYIEQRGFASTLRDRMSQEGTVLARAGIDIPLDDSERVRGIIAPLLDATDKRTAIECLFGDVASQSLGFTERGLPLYAGLALALHDARRAT